MCNATSTKGRFDPGNCPLLAGLSPDQQAARMARDPRIRNCIAQLEGNAAPTSSTSKLLAAYEKRGRANRISTVEMETVLAL
ncbi:hypothetical protein QM467_19100 [Rhodoblastus sp. 17X3]|uniref:hypothetical protein n=1 Tax=Rhodoblastus sp. 17X3 TaxID=3047026 RepID=UPI0024B78F49|nr:hypothetical protein [Rhodoblastus sp. 17X3]MDI9850148.1 hypothetical protein [Rhodoblastus sp. 17X3]